MTRLSAAALSSVVWLDCLLACANLAVSSSPSSSSPGLDPLLLRFDAMFSLTLLRLRTLPPSSPPEPVLFVAGGEGRPEAFESIDSAPGLGGSGRSGSDDGEPELEADGSPRNIADSGRRLGTNPGRGVI